MLRSIWLLMVYVFFLGLGTQAPFVALLGYVWVDTARPQEVTYFILNQVPVAMIMGAAAAALYVTFDRRSPPRLRMMTVCQVTLALWATLSMTWAVAPDGWDKWDWAFKTLMFSACIPLFIRSKVQIEAFLQVYLFSLAMHLVPFAAKVAISGGGYGINLGVLSGNSGLAEGATLATVAIMVIPLAFYLRKYAELLPRSFLFRLVYVALAVAALFCAIGTYQRTGLVGLMVLGVTMVFKSRKKLLTGLVVLTVAGGVYYFSSSGWNSRISTIQTYQQDGSAMTRLLMWRWTLDYVLAHPLGGGFNAYEISVIEHPPDPENPGGYVEHGRAFHSIYFEVLGEQGWVGFTLFVGMLVGAQVMLQRVSRRVRGTPELEWCRALAAALQVSLLVMSACGGFIGIAFQPMIHYLLALSVSVSEYVRRATAVRQETDGGRWSRAAAASPRAAAASPLTPQATHRTAA